MKKRVGVVADDITGANDIGIMFAKSRYRTGVFPSSATPERSAFDGLDVVVLDIDSRFDTKEAAYQKTFEASRLLMDADFDLYYNKTCSVFRGNVGVQFDAMQDALGLSCSMVIAGFPKNGRTTRNGIHYLHGKRLDQSELKNDPVHPTTEAALLKILAKQSERKATCFTEKALDLPFAEKKLLLEKYKKEYSYIIFDVRNQEDLKGLAELLCNEKNICGSSAIGEELALYWEKGDKDEQDTLEMRYVSADVKCTGTLIAAGSLTKQTSGQVDYLKENGYAVYSLDTSAVFDEKTLENMLTTLIETVSDVIQSGKTAVVQTTNTKTEVARTKQMGLALGLCDEQVCKLVSRALSHVVRAVIQNTGCVKIIIAGGDTSAAVSEALRLSKMVIINEIEPGIPTMLAYSNEPNADTDTDNSLLTVFKSGSFGSREFFLKAETELSKLFYKGLK